MKFTINAFLIAVFLLVTSLFIKAQDSSIVPGNILIMVNTEKSVQLLSQALSYINGIKTDLKLKSVLSKNMNIYVLEFNHLSINPQEMLNIIRLNPYVKIAQFNHYVKQRNKPNDPYFYEQWNMNNSGQTGGTIGDDIDAISAWNIATGGLTSQGDSIVVAVIDGGFDLLQEDLNFWKNHHEIPNNKIDDDTNGYVDDYQGWNDQNQKDSFVVQSHGTHVCGIVGAKGSNNIGVTGVNWNVKIMPVASDGQTEASVVAAYSYVLEQRRLYNKTNGSRGAFVVATNSSFGIDLGQPADYPLWCAMYDSLGSVGILSAGATTNANVNVDAKGDIPSGCPSNWLITVTNTDNNDTKGIAGFGVTTIDLGAPGTSILSTYPSNQYESISGTSMATPHVAGAIALMYAVNCANFMVDCKNNPAAMALIIKDSLLNAVDKISSLAGITVTGGRLNLYKSLNAILNRYAGDSCVVVVKPPIDSVFKIRYIYPNPTSNKINVVFNSTESASNITIKIINILGKQVLTASVPNTDKGIQNQSMELETLDNGIYFMQLESQGIVSTFYKVVVVD